MILGYFNKKDEFVKISTWTEYKKGPFTYSLDLNGNIIPTVEKVLAGV